MINNLKHTKIKLSKQLKKLLEQALVTSCFFLLLIGTGCHTEQKSDQTSKQSHFLIKKTADSIFDSSLEYDISEKDLILKSLDSALVLYRKIKDTIGISNTFSEKGYYYVNTYNYKKAWLAFLEQHNYSKICEISLENANSLSNLGLVYSNLRQLDTAEKFYNIALEIMSKLDLPVNEIIMKINLGSIYIDQKNYEAAIKIYKEAIEVSKLLNEDDLEQTSLNNLAFAYYECGDYKQSLKLSLKSLEVQKSYNNHPHSVASVLHTVGVSYLELGFYDKAEKYLIEAKDLSVVNNYKIILIACYRDLSDVMERSDRFNEALLFHKQYFTIDKSIYNDKITREIQSLEANRRLSRIKSQNKINETRIKQNFNTYILIGTILFAILLIVFLVCFYREKLKNSEIKRKKTEVELMALRAQMNPHFIFNTINSLQNLILKSDKFKAYEYLIKFSKAIRLILDNSKESFVTLDKELDLIRLYIRLQQLRFESLITYEECIDEQMDLSTRIPSMFIQPIIENAILHGLLGKTFGGTIKVKLFLKENYIHCIIIDNGIGRTAAAIKKDQNKKDHLSMATKNSKDRIRMLINNGYKKSVIKIFDLYDSKGEALGTKVLIVLPIINK
ncbi:tetratricopeptide repeat-containing sensor histidine kinase [Aquimarina sp. M1]